MEEGDALSCLPLSSTAHPPSPLSAPPHPTRPRRKKMIFFPAVRERERDGTPPPRSIERLDLLDFQTRFHFKGRRTFFRVKSLNFWESQGQEKRREVGRVLRPTTGVRVGDKDKLKKMQTKISLLNDP